MAPTDSERSKHTVFGEWKFASKLSKTLYLVVLHKFSAFTRLDVQYIELRIVLKTGIEYKSDIVI